MNLYRKIYFLIYNLVLKTPSRDEYPYFIANITLSGIISFNIFLLVDIFLIPDLISVHQKTIVLFLYFVFTIFNYIYFYKSYRDDNKKDVSIISIEFSSLVLLILMPVLIVVLNRNGYF
ncbi:membrane hypothetical protein [Tenacibaculum sp. 190524A02b]|uniref:DUF805 domain-containing protein n=1 Tax=Tenacibaculum vairaonense TaxID=3137860 RepID=A0ABM9PQQ1_9FLAO